MRIACYLILVATAGAAAGCGDDEATGTTEPQAQPAAMETEASERPALKRKGTRVVLRSSEFGPMLFSAERRAIYIFERDRPRRSVCYGDCAEAWPPVLTKGKPVAGPRVKSALLGTIKRRDGTRQVTYDGKPLYFYAHERPGEVRCHNVDLNGGFWWVIGRDGKRRP